MQDKFYKKKVLLTGAGGFLGSHFTSHLLSKKCIVYAIDIDLKKLKCLEKNLKNKNLKIFKSDITSLEQVEFLYKKITQIDTIDVIINNAAIDAIPNASGNYSIRQNTKSILRDINVSIIGSNNIIQSFLKHLQKSKIKKIINIGSDLSVIAPNQKIYKNVFKNYKKPISYSVTKHAMLGLTKYYSSLLAENNIAVNMLSPGPIFNNQKKKFLNNLKEIIPMKRLGSPNDLLSSLDFYMNENNNYVTGQNIIIDGGRTVI